MPETKGKGVEFLLHMARIDGDGDIDNGDSIHKKDPLCAQNDFEKSGQNWTQV